MRSEEGADSSPQRGEVGRGERAEGVDSPPPGARAAHPQGCLSVARPHATAQALGAPGLVSREVWRAGASTNPHPSIHPW